jgi:osmotically-inducible protein OsmY
MTALSQLPTHQPISSFGRLADQAAPSPPSTADFELATRVSLYLQQRLFRASRDVAVEARDGVITLAGTAPTFYERQLLGVAACRVAGVRQLVDRLHVLPTAARRGDSGSSTATRPRPA